MTSRTKRTDRLDKNYIINGGFDFYQRKLSIYTTSVPSYPTADRWAGNGPYTDLTGNHGSRRQEDAPVQMPSLRYSNQFRYTSNGSGSVCNLNQRVESIFARDLAGQDVSLGFWIKNTDMQNIQIKFYTADVIDVFGASTVILDTTIAADQSGDWTFMSLEDIALPVDVARGLEVAISFNTPTASAVEQSIYVTGIKLNIGKFAQDFSYSGRDWVEELSLCQRYFEKTYDLDVEVGTVTDWGRITLLKHDGLNELYQHFDYKVIKATPTVIVTVYSPTSGNANQGSDGTAMSATNPGMSGSNLYMNRATNGPTTYVHVTAESEI
tara:strand:+ start:52055 stop:53026 length:972 start_codon:yes stop_codon:yes gene_type:complete